MPRKTVRPRSLDKKKRTQKMRIALFLFGALIVLLFLYFVDLNPQWQEPSVRKSDNGVLSMVLAVVKQKVLIGGKEKMSQVYNGTYIADTWDIRGGDTVKVRLENGMTDPTNLHFHGGHISPKGHSDNVLVAIKPGETFAYEYKLPATHPPGLYWYHPHLHRYTDSQVMGGMLGAIIVRGDIDELPGIKGVPERLLVMTTEDAGNNVIRLVNNQKNPVLFMRPYETIRLRLLNASADDFYNFSIPGKTLHVISRDGNTLSEVEQVQSEVMAPGDRVEVLLQAGSWGEYIVKSLLYKQGAFTYPEDTFMTIRVAGFPVLPDKLPTTLLPYDNFSDAVIDNTRTLTFSEGGTAQNTTFLLDGKEFNPEVIDQIMTLGTTEEWHIINQSSEIHPFHIHINPFQVVSVNGQPLVRKGMDDTFPIPAKGEIVIRTKYRDFDGKYVLHCHILFHEDHGMMQLVEVVKPGASSAPDNGLPDREGMLQMREMAH
ncbi:MAG: hypothetical protein RLZZ455_125 [Candidatus Parcubacteria bacterium]|jgi:FtsP/CotA-like multicopper oxidase with cupredoxin domain